VLNRQRAIRLALRSLIVLCIAIGLNAREGIGQSRVYVSDPGNSMVFVVDTTSRTVIATIPVQINPKDIKVNPAGTRAYVANSSSQTVSVIDTTTNTVIATIPVGTVPVGIGITPDGRHVYVGNRGTISVINAETNVVETTILVGSPKEFWGVAVTPDGTRVYVVDINVPSVYIVDTSTNTVANHIPLPNVRNPRFLAISHDGNRVYVAGQDSNTVSVIDVQTNTLVTNIPVGISPFFIAITPDGARAYVANNGGNVTVIDTLTNSVTATVELSGSPLGIAVSNDGSYAYVARSLLGSVAVIETLSNTVVANISVGSFLYGIATMPSTDLTPPTTTAETFPLPNTNGWNNSSVNVTLNAADNQNGSGVKEINYSLNGGPDTIVNSTISVTGEGINSIWFFATDNAGNSETPHVIDIKIDKSTPIINAGAVAGGSAYLPGTWTNQNVTVSFTCSDVGPSGIASVTTPVVIGVEGLNQTVEGICSDNAGNSSSIAFSSVNIDKTAPVLIIPPSISRDATSPAGATVVYSISATDNLDVSLSLNCSSASGSIFSNGDTVVTCSANDDAGNVTSRSFNVHIRGASEQITNLIVLINSFNLSQGTANSLKTKLDSAQAAISTNNTMGACSDMDSFINQAQIQSGKKITESQANQLIAVAIRIKGALGCP